MLALELTEILIYSVSLLTVSEWAGIFPNSVTSARHGEVSRHDSMVNSASELREVRPILTLTTFPSHPQSFCRHSPQNRTAKRRPPGPHKIELSAEQWVMPTPHPMDCRLHRHQWWWAVQVPGNSGDQTYTTHWERGQGTPSLLLKDPGKRSWAETHSTLDSPKEHPWAPQALHTQEDGWGTHKPSAA